jgi:DNA-binding XRE family transcriptional regulator
VVKGNSTKAEPVITAGQCKAARALLDWKQVELAKKAKVAEKTLVGFERGDTAPYVGTLTKIRQTLERGGVEFIAENGGGVGVRLRKRGRS